MSEPNPNLQPTETLSDAALLGVAPRDQFETRVPTEEVAGPPATLSLRRLPGESIAGKAVEVGENTQRLGRFEVRGEIGRGGMGAVLRGHDPLLGRDLALKILLDGQGGHAEARQRFLEEAQVGGQLQHPGVVPVYEIGQTPAGAPFFAMKLVQGRTLAALLAERAHPADDLPRFLTIFEQVCQTLAYAHARGVLHRDLKPANIMVGAFGEVQVMDWGLAKVLDRADPVRDETATSVRTVRSDSNADASRAGSVLGTPAYMPPEQARGEPVDERADVFGLGAILCEMLTGKPPFAAASALAALELSARGQVLEALTRLDSCGGEIELVQLAREALAAERESRPRDAAAVAARVTAYRAGVQERLRAAELERAAAEARAAEARAKAAAEARARRLTMTLAATILLAITSGGGTALWLRHRHLEAVERETRETAERERAIAGDLQEAAAFQRDSRWADAWAAVERAEGRLASGGDESLRASVQAVRHDLEAIRTDQEMANRLDEARLLVLDRAQAEGFDREGAAQAFRDAFRDYGIDLEAADQQQAVERIVASALRARLVAALDDWTRILPAAAQEERAKLTLLAGLADPDPWRAELRRAVERRDWAEVRRQADSPESAQLPPGSRIFLADALRRAGLAERGRTVLAAGQRLAPADFWINFELATACMNAKPARAIEAVRYYTAAQALRPQTYAVANNLGLALLSAGQPVEAAAAFRQGLQARPNDPAGHYNLGAALLDQNQPAQAAAAFLDAIRLKADYPRAWYNLGLALANQKLPAEAEAAYRQALRLQPEHAQAQCNLGVVLAQQGRLTDAVAAYRRALTLQPEDAITLCNLGHALRRLGEFGEAADAFRRGHELGSRRAGWSAPSARWLQDAQRLADLDARLPQFLDGKLRPASPVEQIELALLCVTRKRYRAAAGFFTAALQADPKLADPLTATHRFNAACCAVLAGEGQGVDPPADSASRADLRRQALRGLRADLVALTKRATTSTPQERALIRNKLAGWQRDADLASVRDPARLRDLPDDERRDWLSFWSEVSDLERKLSMGE